MRRIIFTPLLMLMAALFAPIYSADTFIAGFEDGETGYEVNTEWADGYTWEIVNNTETSGINNSDKCLMTTITNPTPDRWGLWVVVTFTQPILITEANRYVKIMAKRSPNNVNMALCVFGSDPWGANTYFGLTKPAQAGTWGDIVFDLFMDDAAKTCQNKEIPAIMICLGTWDGSEPGVTMLDNIVLSDNPKPRGAQEINPGLLVNFENEDLTAKNFADFEVQSTSASCEVADNPVKDVTNPSDKCMVYNKPANTTWWNALISMVNGIIPVEYPNSYLHVMMYLPDASPVTIMAKTPSGKEANEKFYPADGEGWYDYVLDVSELNYITEISFRFNHVNDEDWDNPQGTYYVDDFALLDAYEPRETITSGVKESAIEDLQININDGMLLVSSPDLNSATIYSVNGQIIGQQQAAGTNLSFSLFKGIYIITIEGKGGQVVKKKVIVE